MPRGAGGPFLVHAEGPGECPLGQRSDGQIEQGVDVAADGPALRQDADGFAEVGFVPQVDDGDAGLLLQAIERGGVDQPFFFSVDRDRVFEGDAAQNVAFELFGDRWC